MSSGMTRSRCGMRLPSDSRQTDPMADVLDTIRMLLVSGGYFESITFGWVSDLLAADFTPPEAIGLARADATVRKADASLRPSILPGLLESVHRNENVGVAQAKLFEIGSTFWVAMGGGIDEHRRVSLVGSTDLREVRGVVELLLNRLNPGCDVRSRSQCAARLLAARRAGASSGAGRLSDISERSTEKYLRS